MLKGSKAQAVSLGILYALAMTKAVAISHMKDHTVKYHPHRIATRPIILGQTDVAPDYVPPKTTLAFDSAYHPVPNHLQQSYDYSTGIGAVYGKNYVNVLNTTSVLTLSFGGTVTGDAGRTQSVAGRYVFHPHHATQAGILLGVFLGQELAYSENLAVQFGLAYYQPTAYYPVRGQLVDSNSGLYAAYRYKIMARQILFEGKFLGTVSKVYHPYFSLGLGESFNSVYRYQGSPLPLSFDMERNRSFSYRVGLGVDVDVVDHLRLGLGYRFVDYGKVNLRKGNFGNNSVQDILQQTRFYTHEFLGQISYLFN